MKNLQRKAIILPAIVIVILLALFLRNSNDKPKESASPQINLSQADFSATTELNKVSGDFVPDALEIEKSETNNTLGSELEKPEVKDETPKLLSYRIIQTEDLSYSGCKRIGVRLVVPDESIKTDVDYTLKKISDDYTGEWDDITIWAWGYSEEADVGSSGFTKGMYETGSCY